MTYPIPRFQGRAFEKDGAWSWEFHVSMLGDDEGSLFSTKLTFSTKDEAVANLRLAISDAIKTLADEFPEMGINSENYIDMKTNTTRRWDKKDEQ